MPKRKLPDKVWYYWTHRIYAGFGGINADVSRPFEILAAFTLERVRIKVYGEHRPISMLATVSVFSPS